MRFPTSTSILTAAFAATVRISTVQAITWGRICDGTNLGGTCTDFGADNLQCLSFAGDYQFWNDMISSIDIYDGPWGFNSCIFYADWGCTGAQKGYKASHGPYNSLDDHNNRHSSFKCANPGY